MKPIANGIVLAERVRKREISAVQLVESALQRAAALNPTINASSALLEERALREAEIVDQQIANGLNVGPLAGVPYAVKNLFDIEGITTLAGSRIDRELPPAATDATLISRLQRAGACLVAATNMDEYAYGFSTENTHYGATRNPHDTTRIVGGSSGGSAAIVAANIVPFSLGSDTNGSIRVPASLCGIYGLKPTYGRLSRAGTKPFVASLDHVGPFARSANDLAILLDVMGGPDPRDPVCFRKELPPVAPMLDKPWKGVRSVALTGYFERWSSKEAQDVVNRVSQSLGSTSKLEIPLAEIARSAAYLITVAEGANLHFPNLKKRPLDFDPLTRDRFLAGALLPSSLYIQAQRFRCYFQREMAAVFANMDILIAPTTPISAPPIGELYADFNGERLIARHNLGLYTQPFSFIGLPAISVPVIPSGKMPLGVMLVGAPFSEGLLLQAAQFLEKEGVIAVSNP